jgi:hypothetical protein
MIIDVTDIEIDLAEWLAEMNNRDPSFLDLAEEIGFDPDDPAALEGYEEGLIEGALDKIAERVAAFSRPRPPLYQLIDRVCGIVRDE